MHRRTCLQAMALAAVAHTRLTVAGTPGEDEPPVPGPERGIVVPAWQSFSLDNGIQVLVVPRRHAPVVSANLLFRAGPECEPEPLPGLADMTATLLPKGAWRKGKAASASALAREAEGLGGALNTGTGWRATHADMTVTTPQLDAALGLLADVMLRPLLLPEELERARTQALDGLKLTLSSPGAVAGLAARRAFWPVARYGSSATADSLKRIGLTDVKRFHQEQLLSAETMLVLTGDIDESNARVLASRHLGRWPQRTSRPRPSMALLGPTAMREAVLDLPGSGQTSVVLSLPCDAMDGPMRRVAQVANAVLGVGYSSRLSQDIRIRQGLGYDVRSDLDLQPEGTLLMAQAQTDHRQAFQVLASMKEQLRRMRDDEAKPAELRARQAAMTGGFARRLQTVQGLNGLFSQQWASGRPLEELGRYVDEVLAVSAQQVQTFAQAQWRADRVRAIVAGDTKAMDGAWKTQSPTPVFVGRQQLDLSFVGLQRPE